jgi:outer membrane immunogenic protein
MVRVLLLSSCFALASVVSASASDLGTKRQPAKAAPAPVVSPKGAERWAGFYSGAHAGFGFGDITARDLEDGSSFKFDHTGPIGGIHAGYNFVAGSWVLGLEGEFDAGVIRGSKYDADADSSPPEPATLRTRMPWLAAVGPRIGHAFGDALIYASGGIAFGRDTMKVTEESGDITKKSENRIGWSVGGGAEYALDKRWSVRADYRYFNLGSKTYRDDDPTDGVRVKADAHAIRIGLTYSFGNVR